MWLTARVAALVVVLFFVAGQRHAKSERGIWRVPAGLAGALLLPRGGNRESEERERLSRTWVFVDSTRALCGHRALRGGQLPLASGKKDSGGRLRSRR